MAVFPNQKPSQKVYFMGDNLMEKSKRATNMELLRIISMIFIVALHYVTFGQLFTSTSAGVIYISKAIHAFTYCCIDLFILISGWFYKSESRFSIEKATQKTVFLWLKVFFYSIILFAVFLLSKSIKPYAGLFIETFAPITCNAYWFLSSYVILIFLIPFIDKIISTITLKQHLEIVSLILLFVCVPATIFPKNWLIDEKEGYSFVWFICLYIIGAFLKRVYGKFKGSKCWFLFGYIIFSLSIFAYWFIVKALCEKVGVGDRSDRVYRYTSLPVLLAAVCLFEFFARVNINSEKISKLILKFSNVTFDVYIIHCYELMGGNLFQNILHCKDYINSKFMPLHFVICVVIVYLGCSLFAIIRAELLDKPFKKLSDKAGYVVKKLESKIF